MLFEQNPPKMYTAQEKQRAVEKYADQITYSSRYSDDQWEYRHVHIPKALVKYLPPGVTSEAEWRGIGIRQSAGWVMYLRHAPEPHVLLFKRDKDYDLKHPPLRERPYQSRA
ncbi:cyclin-dependent kinase regulatory subunit CKS1 [Filobasidium floriforme]|uniref:cyclin-dependent kinase regulatory subunit CKS1 n=1 Tax=Filobasidium floriforme TaxID=5210 RepID=UPI001E8E17A2|nr:cyclin-dependent kinase regulatory subunit CKS1 [Filobasidium floriforme]KAH8086393.1 cyclin-dependent kinase regulatory subunit CKS1 [Filobasidium floriforme]